MCIFASLNADRKLDILLIRRGKTGELDARNSLRELWQCDDDTGWV